MTKKKRSVGTTILILLFFISICGLGMAMLWGVDQGLTVVMERYGDPDPNLTIVQRAKLTFELYIYGNDLFYQPDLLNEEMIFSVDQGESIYLITEQLQAAGYLKNAEIFINYLVYKGYDRRIQAGRFSIVQGMNAIDIAGKLIDPIPEKIRFVVLAGWRAEEIAEAVEASGLPVSKTEFLSVVQNPPANWLPENFPILSSLEGYLAPGEYYFDRDITTAALVRMMIQQFDATIDIGIRTEILDKGYSLDEVIILASIVEREAVVNDEMPMIASVFLNRYGIGMKLDSDPTTQYAIGYNEIQGTWWTNPLSWEDLKIDSPYNTYIYEGLPPFAICNPSKTAILAVINPAETPYYYFRAKCDGSGEHEFAVTYEEHLLNGCE